MSSCGSSGASCSGSSESSIQQQVAEPKDNKSARNEDGQMSASVITSGRVQLSGNCPPIKTRTAISHCSSWSQNLPVNALSDSETSTINQLEAVQVEESGLDYRLRVERDSLVTGGIACIGTASGSQPSFTPRHSTVIQQEGPESAEAKRVKRLISVFRFWCPVSDIRQEENSHTDMSGNRQQWAEIEVPSAMNVGMFGLQAPSAISSTTHIHPHGPHLNSSDMYSESADDQKVHRWLEIPLVLGCVIFLIVVWIRQISVLIINNTAIMLILLGAILLIISSVTFWFAYTHKNAPTINSSLSNTCLRQSGHSTGDSGDSGEADNLEPGKCCHISVIDCKPPDYYSALRNSYPVPLNKQSRYPMMSADFWSHAKQPVCMIQEGPTTSPEDISRYHNSDLEQDMEGQPPPPSYDRLTEMYNNVVDISQVVYSQGPK